MARCPSASGSLRFRCYIRKPLLAAALGGLRRQCNQILSPINPGRSLSWIMYLLSILVRRNIYANARIIRHGRPTGHESVFEFDPAGYFGVTRPCAGGVEK